MGQICVEHLTKDYKNNKGVFDLNFEIQKGEVFGYLGPNGAGKTTTIRHLLGFLNADSGLCKIGEYDCRKDAHLIQKDLGYLPGEITFFDEMTGKEFLKFMADMRQMKDFTKMNYLIDFFELDPSGRMKKMSKGMKQKIGLVCAFMHNPTTLILDEPTSGLDPLMQNKFIQLILKEKSEGKTILMSSHSFEEVERTCDRVGIIRKGKFVAVETVEKLKKSKRKVYAVTFEDENAANRFSKESFEIISQDGCRVEVAIVGDLKQFIAKLNEYPVVLLDEILQTLEQIFMTYYGEEK
ncbi:MAG: ABC transporter ATP-binding protein [Cellulosilyticaceae bacterium]